MFSAIRQRLRLRSVRARLTFWYLLTLGGSLLAFAAFVFVMRVDTLYHGMDAALDARTHDLASDLRPQLFALDISAALAASEQARTSELIVRESPGDILYRSPGFPQLGWSGDAALTLAARDGAPIFTISDLDGASVRVATLQVPRPGARPLALQVAAPLEPLHAALRGLAIAMLIGIVVVLCIASYGSGITARRALAPVDEIVARARHIQAVKPGERLDVHAGSAELDRLVLTLNEMLDRIQASMRAARRFAADASHELQTPLTVMRGLVERSILKGADGPEMDLLAEIERCSAMVRDLKLLALAEAGQVVSGGEVMDLGTVTQECSEIARAIAEDKNIRVETRIDVRPRVIGSALHLRRVILNLTDNAIRYSMPGSSIEIRLTSADGCASVSVSDHGCGIDADDLSHIFEPFYRTDPARARDTGGTGLGLAIADQIVRAHGGAIAVSSDPGAGSTFTMTLPLAPSMKAL